MRVKVLTFRQWRIELATSIQNQSSYKLQVTSKDSTICNLLTDTSMFLPKKSRHVFFSTIFPSHLTPTSEAWRSITVLRSPCSQSSTTHKTLRPSSKNLRGTRTRSPSVFFFGLVWFGLVWFGLVWFGLVWFGLVWFGLVWFGLVWFGLDDGFFTHSWATARKQKTLTWNTDWFRFRDPCNGLIPIQLGSISYTIYSKWPRSTGHCSRCHGK